MHDVWSSREETREIGGAPVPKIQTVNKIELLFNQERQTLQEERLLGSYLEPPQNTATEFGFSDPDDSILLGDFVMISIRFGGDHGYFVTTICKVAR